MTAQQDLFKEPQSVWQPSRHIALGQLHHFVQRAAKTYAGTRNYDFGPNNRKNVSILSPWLRTRLITETEVLRAVLSRHSPASCEKFVQEVLWRGYFKGWLEHRPKVWDDYLTASESLDRSGIKRAINGTTGIDCFDAWVAELCDTGYLHNHARMWFASIWIFTLGLPWQLGAAFFMQHLLDGDPASNTLSWRWVAGLHTKGKHYIARVDNILQFSNGRFDIPQNLNTDVEPLHEPIEYGKQSLIWPKCVQNVRSLLITEEDCGTWEFADHQRPSRVFALQSDPENRSALVNTFRNDAVQEAARNAAAQHGADLTIGTLGDLCRWAGSETVTTAYVPVGAVRSALLSTGIAVQFMTRDYDRSVWPHATAGFFKVKKKIPQILTDLGIGMSFGADTPDTA